MASNFPLGTPRALPTILYDGTCRFCIGQAARLKRLARGRVAAESAYAAGVRDRFPMLPPAGDDGKIGEIKFVDARRQMYGGAEAIARVLITGGGPLGWLARLYYVPVARQIADAGYRAIAKRRYRLRGTCEDGSCEV